MGRGIVVGEAGAILAIARFARTIAPWLLVAVLLTFVSGTVNVTTASRESKRLVEFGAEFEMYRHRVRACVPVRRRPELSEHQAGIVAGTSPGAR